MKLTLATILFLVNMVMAGYGFYFFKDRFTYDTFIPACSLVVLCIIAWTLIFNLEDHWLNTPFFGGFEVKRKSRKEWQPKDTT